MTKLTKSEFFARFQPSIHDRLEAALQTEGTAGLVLFENQDLWSSSMGAISVMRYGPGCTYKAIEEIKGSHLNDLPSQRQYPTAYTEKEGK